MYSKQQESLLNMQQACDMLACHPNTLRRWDNKGRLVAVRIGVRRDRRWRKSDVTRIIEEGDTNE